MREYFTCSAAFAAVAFAFISQAAFADVVVTEKEAGKTIEVKLGDPLVVKLTGRGDSGYYWRLDSDLTPELILSGRTVKTVEVPTEPQVTTFTFTTAAPGQLMFKASNLKAGAPIPTGHSDVVFAVNVVP